MPLAAPILSQMDRRRESRVPAHLAITVWGVDARGTRFAQMAQACNISRRGALVSGLDQPLRSEDLIGIQYGERRAKFRVIWLRDSHGAEKILAAVERLEAETCPWLEELPGAGARQVSEEKKTEPKPETRP